MENGNQKRLPDWAKRFLEKHRKKITIISSTAGILFVLYWLYSSGHESIVSRALTPFFNMIGWFFSQTFFTLPLKWLPLAVVVCIIGLIALVLLLWPYIMIGVSFVALIVKTLWNKTKKRKRLIRIGWAFFFAYMFVLWFAMANNAIRWLPGKSQAEYVLYKKCNPWAERYTPESAKKVVGEKVAEYMEVKYGIDVTIDAAKRQSNVWKWVNVVWEGAKTFFFSGLF